MTSDDVRNALGRLDGLDCKSAASLELKYHLKVFNRDVESPPEHALALYQPGQHSLWAIKQNGHLPWAPLARELAIALCPEEDPGLFAAGLKEVLAADALSEAVTVLDELGFSQLDTTVVEVPHGQESADHLGIDALPDSEELPPHQSNGASQSDIISTDVTASTAETEERTAEAGQPGRPASEF